MEFIEYLAAIRTNTLDMFFQFCTYFGEELFVVAVLCICYWCINKENAYKMAVSYFLAGLCIQVLKITFRIPRPWVRNPEFRPVESARAAATGYSFPSGHTQGVTTLGISLICSVKEKWMAILAGMMIVFVAFSRMYLGVHTPEDVLVSFVISAVITACVHRYYDVWFHDKNVGKNAWILVMFSLLVILYASYLLQTGVTSMELVDDCYKSGGAGIGFAIGYYIEKKYIDFDIKDYNKWICAIKLFFGLAGAVLLKSGLKWVAGESPIVNMLRYALVVVWILAIYPYIWQKLQDRKK